MKSNASTSTQMCSSSCQSLLRLCALVRALARSLHVLWTTGLLFDFCSSPVSPVSGTGAECNATLVPVPQHLSGHRLSSRDYINTQSCSSLHGLVEKTVVVVPRTALSHTEELSQEPLLDGVLARSVLDVRAWSITPRTRSLNNALLVNLRQAEGPDLPSGYALVTSSIRSASPRRASHHLAS